MISIVDEVNTALATKEFEESISKYVQALESLKTLQNMGIVQEKGSMLLPIEERYKSVYTKNIPLDNGYFPC
jgi:hypothetical protein